MAKSMFKRMKKIEDRLDRLEALIMSEKKPFNIEEAVRDGILSAVGPVREDGDSLSSHPGKDKENFCD